MNISDFSSKARRKPRSKRPPRWSDTGEKNPALMEAIPVSDASAEWDVTRSAINAACSAGNFPPKEFIKVKNGYLVTRTGMTMAYGKPLKEDGD